MASWKKTQTIEWNLSPPDLEKLFSAKVVFEVRKRLFLPLTISWLKQAPFHTHQPEFWLMGRYGGHCRRPNWPRERREVRGRPVGSNTLSMLND